MAVRIGLTSSTAGFRSGEDAAYDEGEMLPLEPGPPHSGTTPRRRGAAGSAVVD
jgi:hypothetical protein